MSTLSAVSSAPVQRALPQVTRAVDADGDHDGSTAAAPAPQAAAPALATSGLIGRNLNLIA
jgi:hypothetical protein